MEPSSPDVEVEGCDCIRRFSWRILLHHRLRSLLSRILAITLTLTLTITASLDRASSKIVRPVGLQQEPPQRERKRARDVGFLSVFLESRCARDDVHNAFVVGELAVWRCAQLILRVSIRPK